MPNSKSAEKRVRQNEKARIANKARMTELKNLARKIERALNAGRQPEAAELYRSYAKRLDQAACLGVIHANTASRMKSRFAQKIKAA